MSFNKLKGLWNRNKGINNNDSSLMEKAQGLVSPSPFNKSGIQSEETSQFEDYLRVISVRKKFNQKRQASTSILKPQIIQKCLQQLDPLYLQEKFSIDAKFFEKSKTKSFHKQNIMQDQLDTVEICLFNQVSNRFDQMLSVIRTIQSMEYLVTDNQYKLRKIRSQNFEKSLTVTQKQNKVLKLIRKRDNLKKIIEITDTLKTFQTLSTSKIITDAQSYKLLHTIKQNKSTLSKLKVCKNLDKNLATVENNLKQSFSDKLNQSIFQYLSAQYPYTTNFWSKFINKTNIFEEKQNIQGTGILDESAITQQQAPIVPIVQDLKKQSQIIQNIRNGWIEGHYDSEKIKIQMKQYISAKSQIFLQDFRNFCCEVCKKQFIDISSTNLRTVLREMCPKFCTKVFTYYFEVNKNIIYRIITLNLECLIFIQNQQKKLKVQQIQQKQKLKVISQGFINFATNLTNFVLTKITEIISYKQIHQGIDICQFKQIINIFENIQLFIENKLFQNFNRLQNQQQGDEAGIINQLIDLKNLDTQFHLNQFRKQKQQKIKLFLNNMHKNVLTVEMKESLENELWTVVDIPTFYYDSLHYLITGQSLNLRRNKFIGNKRASMMYETSVLMQSMFIQHKFNKKQQPKIMADFRIIRNDIIIKNQSFKITQTALLMIQFIEDYMNLAQNFPSVKQHVGYKLNQLIRSYNSSSSQLIVHRGALALKKINSKAIKAKHLAISSVSLSFLLLIIDFISQRIAITEVQKLKNSILDHIAIIVGKLNWILLEKSKSAIQNINLQTTPSKGTQIIVSNTKMMYEILSQYYDTNTLRKIFTEQILDLYFQGIQTLKTTISTKSQAQFFRSDITFLFEELEFLQQIMPKFEEYRMKAEDVIRVIFESL